MITFVTGNANKLKEVKQLLGTDLESKKIDLPEMQGSYHDIVTAKVKEAAEQVHGPVVVDDTSLEFDAFGKELPGPYIKWFLTQLGPEGLVKLLSGFENKSGSAVCSVGYCESPGKPVHVFIGKTAGKIVDPRGPRDFGWDCIFEPTGFEKTYAEMEKSQKNEISHRGKAFAMLREFLQSK